MTQIASDAFTNSNGTAITTHNANWVSASAGASAVITSNSIRSAGAEGAYYWNATFPNDQYAQGTLVALASGMYLGPAVRCSSNNFYFYAAGSDYWELVKIVAGVWTELGESGTPTVNDVLRIEAIGDVITPYVNGAVHSAIGAKTDTSHASGKAGIFVEGNGTGTRLDDWSAGDFVTTGINTAARRASVQAYSGGASAIVGYLGAVAAIDVSDRAHVTELYRGLAYGPQGVVIAPDAASIIAAGFAPTLTITLAGSTGVVSASGQTPAIDRVLAASTGATVTAGASPTLAATLAASTGVVAVTGLAASLTTTLAGVAGAATVTGNAPAIATIELITLVPTTGAVTAAGVAPKISLALSAVTGVVTANGVLVSRTLILSPSVGTATVVGNAPTLDVLTQIVIAPSTGAVSAAGIASALVQALAPSSAAIAAAGNAATRATVLAASSAAVSLSGNAPTLAVLELVQIAPSAGAVAATGSGPLLVRGIAPSDGATAVAGNAPAIAKTLAANTGGVSAAGNAPSFAGQAVLAPSTGQAVTGGNAPALSVLIAASSASVAASGFAPALSLTLVGQTGAAVIAGQFPTLAGTGVLSPTTGVVSVIGNAPSIAIAGILVLEPAPATVAASGNQPFIPAITKLPPDVILASSNLAGAYTDIDDDPTNPDGSWLTASSATVATDLRVGFVDPPPISLPDGAQRFLAYVRKTAGATTPTVDIELWQNGALVSTLLNDAAVTSTTGELLDASWNSSALTGTLDGSDVQCRIVATVGVVNSPGALPGYSAAGTLSNTLNANVTNLALNSPAHVAGDLLIAVVAGKNSANNFLLSSANGAAGTSGWTLENNGGAAYGGAQTQRICFAWKVAASNSEVCAITTTGGVTTARVQARVYKFTAANGFATNAVTAIGTATTGSGTSLSMPSVSAGGNNERAVAIYGIAAATTVAAATGETGGNWTEPIAENSIAATTGEASGLQISDQSNGAGISGGTSTLGTTGVWVAVGFRIVPATIQVATNTVEIGAIEWQALLGPRTIVLNAVSGSVAATGIAPSLFKSLNAIAGGTVVTGNAPTIFMTRELTPATGVVSVTGATPAVSLALAPALASVAAIGQAPSLFKALGAQPASVTAVGSAASLYRTLASASGSVAVSGNTPSVSYAGQIIPFTGEIAATGFAPSLVSRILPASASIGFAGGTPVLSVNRELSPTAGGIAATGNAPGLPRTIQLDPTSGAVAIAGTAVSLTRSLTPASGQASVVGNVPTVRTLVEIAPASAVIAVGGNAPAFIAIIAANDGAVAVSGNAAEIIRTRFIDPDTGLVTIAGIQPTIDLTRYLNPGVGIVDAIGGLPTLQRIVPKSAGGNYVLVIDAEERTLAVDAEERTIIVPAEDREVVVYVEERQVEAA